MTDQAWVNLQALNARSDVSRFQIEVFDPHGWAPSRAAVATPDQITVPASIGDTPLVRPIRVLIDLRGQPQREVLVCTKSVRDSLEPNKLVIGTRVCSRVKVLRFGA